VFQGISGLTARNGVDSQERKHCGWRSGKWDDAEKGREQANQKSSGYEKTRFGCGLFQEIPGLTGRNRPNLKGRWMQFLKTVRLFLMECS